MFHAGPVDENQENKAELRKRNPNYDAECAIKEWINTLPTSEGNKSLFPIKFVLELPNAQVICRATNVMVLEFIINLRSEQVVFLEPAMFRERILKYYQEKMDRRYNRDHALERMKNSTDPVIETALITWISGVTGVSLETETKTKTETGKASPPSLSSYLKDGRLLCQLANGIRPGCIERIESAEYTYKQMENISYFIRAW